MGTQKNRLNEMGNYSAQNICLNRWLRKYSQLKILFGFVSGLHDESGRLQILSMIIHTMVMRENDKLATDVYLTELATLTKNFRGAEIEGLVRCAQATAMNQLIKVRRSEFTLGQNFFIR